MKEIILISILLITGTVLVVIKNPPDTLRMIIKRHHVNVAMSTSEISSLQRWVVITFAYLAVMLNAYMRCNWYFPHDWLSFSYVIGAMSFAVYTIRNIFVSSIGSVYASSYRSIVSGTVSGTMITRMINQQLKMVMPLWYINLALHAIFVSLSVYAIYHHYT